ncbi:PI-PLC X domain-containing protein 2-like [Limulus polyphemus]|uniref:PI-PLC X domain-containing protein 2-like n=1 Tax=Limulus polyphemus TaxID=6850 RepID=A0ABM1BVY0_LIMPO|nr:PI-PLC X domain-containing protein 2-like [Limulus polyphemus]
MVVCPNDDPEILSSGDKNVRVFLTVSSLASILPSGEMIERQLELNWVGGDRNTGDIVALYNHNPEKSLDSPVVTINPLLYVVGCYRTNVQFPHLRFTSNNLTSDCLGFWVVYLRQGEILGSSCLRARPFWMKENDRKIRNIPLVKLMIPGTHNSGSYRRYKGLESETVFLRYLYNQEETIFNQLAYGIRFLDLRVGFYPHTNEKFWINHRLFSVNNTLVTVLQDVASFLQATQEVVLIDFHNFPTGFSYRPEIHRWLIRLVLEHLGPYMVPRHVGPSVTLGTLWNIGKRLLVSYNSRHYISNGLLWPGVSHIWGNKQTVRDLKIFFDGAFRQSNYSTLSSAMAELTPTIATFFTEPRKGLRGFAHDVNRKITRWFRDLWWLQLKAYFKTSRTSTVVLQKDCNSSVMICTLCKNQRSTVALENHRESSVEIKDSS